MQWAEILTVFAVIVTNLGTVITLFLYGDRKLDEHRKETNEMLQENRKESNEILKAIRDDMNEFHTALREIHGRQERLDAEFKAFLMKK